MTKSNKLLKREILGKSDTIKLILSLIFISAVFLPLIRMLSHMDGETIRKVITSPNFGAAVSNSLVSVLLATVITVVIAFVLAICMRRTNIRFKGVFEIIFALPMLIPSISCGMGLVILFGNNGLITHLLHLDTNIYGLWGIVMGATIYAFPVAYLMLSDVLFYEDGSAYEAAEILGIPKWRQFFSITLPYLRKPLISVIFAVFTMVITDYGVPLMVGGKYTTVAVVMYQEVIGQLNFGKGSVYGAVLLIPAVIAFVIDLTNKDSGKSGYVTRTREPSDELLTKVGSYLYCGFVAIITLLPIIAFVLLSFTKDYPNDLTFTLANLTKAFRLKADKYLLNSIIIALGTAITGVGITFMTAYMSARMKSRTSRFLHLACMMSAALPGVVLGLSYVMTFNNTPIYGTLIILMAVNVIHFIASPYLMIYNSLSKINENLEGVAHTLGVARGYMIRDVFLPQCKCTLIEMFSYFFVNCMMTISAVSFLATTANKPIALMINQFEAQMQLECAAVVSLMILMANIIEKGIFYIAKRQMMSKKKQALAYNKE